jgi:hypothetical protein
MGGVVPVTNGLVLSHAFLTEMYSDSYFPRVLVDKVRDILLTLCSSIEQERPATVDHFLQLTHAATERINELAEEFEDQDSEFETVARESTAADFRFIAETYGFGNVDIEEIIGPRDW